MPAILTLKRPLLICPRLRKRCRCGFTLVEVLLSLTVISLLGAISALALSRARTAIDRAQCASNLRQIGIALHAYAADNNGYLPATSHSASRGENWIYTLAPYLADMDEVRICPADEPARRKQIRQLKTTSYLLNDIVFDPDMLDDNAPRYNNLHWIPVPAQTLFAVISNRRPSATWDHSHTAEWTSWSYMLQDVAIDRHRHGPQSFNRLNGDANYLYADGRVENIDAADWKRRYFDRGINPGAVPTAQ